MAYQAYPSQQATSGFGRRGLADAPALGVQGSVTWGEQNQTLDRATAPLRNTVREELGYGRGNGRSVVAPDLDPAGFWIRVLACVADNLFVMALVLALTFIPTTLGDIRFTEALYFTLNAIVGITYFALFHSGGWQATPAKRLLGVYVVSNGGRALSVSHALGRCLAIAVSVVPLGIGFLVAGWNRDKKALHDYIAGTRAVRGRVG